MSDIPQWARDKAANLCRCHSWSHAVSMEKLRTITAIEFFAKYIAENESPPPNALLLEAREINATYCDGIKHMSHAAEQYRSGEYDETTNMQVTLAALKSREKSQ